MKLIDKDALVAEIERLMTPECGYSMNKLLDYIESLEVKEVDLKKEFKEFLDNVEGVPSVWHSDEQIEWAKDIAKYFFELGLSVNNPITAVERGMVEEIIIILKRLEKDYHIDLTVETAVSLVIREMELLRNKVKKGEEL